MMPSVRFTPRIMWLIRSHSAPMTEPSMVMPPYQMADATPIGTSVRNGLRFTSPAKGGTTARMPGRNRLTKIPATPKRRYSRSMMASERGASSRRPIEVANSLRPYRRATKYTAAAPARLATQVTAKTPNGVVTPRLERKAPSATAASEGTGGMTFSIAASRARTA